MTEPCFEDLMETCSTKLPDHSLVNGLKLGEGCFWCGKLLPPRRRKYCSDKCRDDYCDNLVWGYAAPEALSRVRCSVDFEDAPDWRPDDASRFWEPHGTAEMCYECQECHGLFLEHYHLEVHHIDPLNGEPRAVNVKNRQENLLPLCHECHWGPKYHGKKLPGPSEPKWVDPAQMVMEF